MISADDSMPSEMNEMSERSIRAALQSVIDPELGINIVDLGLIYHLDIQDRDVSIEMTMTAQACPLGDYLRSNARSAILRNVPGVEKVDVHIVWDPPWSPEMISEKARQKLGW